MLKYIVRRLLVAIPTLFVILVISFMISRSVPGDPVWRELDQSFQNGVNVAPERIDKEYRRISHEKGYDLPIFYMSLSALAYPADMHLIPNMLERENLAEMVNRYGDWTEIKAYHERIDGALLQMRALEVPASQKTQFLDVQVAVEALKHVSAKPEIDYHLQLIESLKGSIPVLSGAPSQALDAIATSYDAVQQHASTWKLYIPTLHFHGLHNQFHVWLTALLRLDFGRSYDDRLPVRDKISQALPWTMFMGFFSFLIAYMIAIPIGVYAVRKRNQWQDRALSVGLFLLTSVPTFVMAMLAMTLLCNPEYLQLFPTSGVNSDGAEQWPLRYRLIDYAYHLTLPTLIFSYHSIAYVSRQMRGGMMETIQADYIRTARAKGLPERTVVWLHGVRNALLPIVTLLSGLFTQMIGGAFVTEFIFSVPGMGLLTIGALGSYDHPVILAVFTLTAIATLVGILFSDILYALADPRISFEDQ